MRSNPDPLWAVVAPPHAVALRARLGLAAEAPVRVELSGWSKRVVLTDDLALLFPRDHHNVEYLRREARALRAVAAAGLDEIPRIVDEWDEPALSPYPILVLTRSPGEVLESHLDDDALLISTLERAARLAARWHSVDNTGFDGSEPLFGNRAPHDAAAALCEELAVPARPAFADAIAFARSLDHVLLHGDLHEAQLLVDRGELTGIIDWQTAFVGHPYLEFNFGEWGTAIWRTRRTQLPTLRARQWNAYAAERRLDPHHANVFEWYWCAHQLGVALRNEANGAPRVDITGTVTEARAAFDAAAAKL